MQYLARYQKFVSLWPLKNWSLALIFINLFSVLVVILARNILPPVIPLYYGKPYGIEQLSARENLIIPSLIALTICLLSIAISLRLKDQFLKKVLFGAMLTTTLLSLIATIKIILLVGSI